MNRFLLASCAAGLALAAMPAQATTVADAQGDWAPGYTGAKRGDLDVKSFTVTWDSGASMFRVGATMWDVITPGTEGFYVIGVNTGTGPSHPFGPLGQPNVKFNTVFFVRKDGTGNIGATNLTSNITISGDSFWVNLPLSALPASTGFTPDYYGFNIWPRGAGSQAVSDFAPENSTIAAVPEAGTWAMMMFGLAAVGSCMRARRQRVTFA